MSIERKETFVAARFEPEWLIEIDATAVVA